MIVYFEHEGSVNAKVLQEGRNTVAAGNCEAVFFCRNSEVTVRFPDHKDIAVLHLKPGQKLSLDDADIYAALSPYSAGYASFKKYRLPARTVRIGTDVEDDVYLQNTTAEEIRICMNPAGPELICQVGRISINGRNTSKCNLKAGDCVRTENLVFYYHPEFLMINQTENVYISLAAWEPGMTQALSVPHSKGLKPEYRRISMDSEYHEDLLDPLPYNDSRKNPLIFSMGPAITMASASLAGGILSFYNGMLNGRRVTELLPGILLPAVMLASALIWNPVQRLYEKHREKNYDKYRQASYLHYLQTVQTRIIRFQQEYFAAVNSSFYPPGTLIQNWHKREKIWQKTPLHGDWLYIRLGLGTVRTPVRLNSLFHWQSGDSLSTEIEILKLRCSSSEHQPVLYRFAPGSGTAVLVTERTLIPVLSGLLLQICSYHHPEYLKTAIFAPEKVLRENPWLLRIPHEFALKPVRTRLMATDQKELQAVLDIIDQNEDLQFLLFDLTGELKLPLRNNVHVIHMTDSTIPYDAETVIDYNSHRIIKKEDIQEFVPDPLPEIDLYSLFSDAGISGNDMHQQHISGCTFYDLHAAYDTAGLKIRENWQTNIPGRELTAPIGMDASGSVIWLDLHENGQGPHGLIAGMTGSGKSELIITMILSLAVRYSPDEVQFAVIDFKGGGAASAFHNEQWKLPHLIGNISNLEPEDMNRFLTAFRQECESRERDFRILAGKTGTAIMNLAGYRQAWTGEYGLPYYAELIIIADEFAELKTQQPEFMQELISIARVGRSLGIHLILVTQKPAGVIDEQIRANCRFRICLKVQDRQDSMEVLQDGCASAIRRTGEFYMLCDNMLQHGFGGYVHADEDVQTQYIEQLDRQLNVSAVWSAGGRLQRTQLQAVMQEIMRLPEAAVQRTPFCLPFPQCENIHDRKREAGMLGILDDYRHRKILPFSAGQEAGITAVFCRDRSIKEMFLETLVYTLMENSSDCEIYITDPLNLLPDQLKESVRIIDILREDDKEKTMNMIRHFKDPGSKRYLILTDTGMTYADDEIRSALQELYSHVRNDHLHIFLFGSTAASISYRDLALADVRIALKNDNLQELTAIFEKPVRKAVRQERRILVWNGQLYEGVWYRCTKDDLNTLIKQEQSKAKYEIPHMPACLKVCEHKEDEIVLGKDRDTYEWVMVPKDKNLVVLSTYADEADFLLERLQREGNLCEADEIISGQKTGIFCLTAEMYQLMKDQLPSGLSILYVGAGFHEQYLFRTKTPVTLGEKDAVLFERHRSRVIRLAE